MNKNGIIYIYIYLSIYLSINECANIFPPPHLFQTDCPINAVTKRLCLQHPGDDCPLELWHSEPMGIDSKGGHLHLHIWEFFKMRGPKLLTKVLFILMREHAGAHRWKRTPLFSETHWVSIITASYPNYTFILYLNLNTYTYIYIFICTYIYIYIYV